MKVENVKIENVFPYSGNPRSISDVAVEKVARSLKEFGWQQPIVVDKDYVIIVGHTRLKAAKSLGMTEVPIFVADGLSDSQVKAYRIADNKTGELTSWDDGLLKTELELLQALDAEMEDTGFSEKELMKALMDSDSDAEGSQELNSDDFQDFEHKCPRCGFEYNKDAKPDAEPDVKPDED